MPHLFTMRPLSSIACTLPNILAITGLRFGIFHPSQALSPLQHYPDLLRLTTPAVLHSAQVLLPPLKYRWHMQAQFVPISHLDLNHCILPLHHRSESLLVSIQLSWLMAWRDHSDFRTPHKKLLNTSACLALARSSIASMMSTLSAMGSVGSSFRSHSTRLSN